MKYLYLLVLLLLVTVETSAQTLSDSSDLSVLQKKWRINFDASDSAALAAVSENQFPAIREANQTMQILKDEHRQNVIRQQQGLPPERPRVRQTPSTDYSRRKITTSYIYQIKVRNNGNRTIKEVVWEYVFLDPNTNQKIGRHQFTSRTNLKPRETDSLVTKLPSPPTRIINAKDAGKKLSNRYIEQVNIKSIQYSDGTVWNADSK